MQKMMLVLLAVSVLSACSSPNTKPGDGRDWIQVTCNGFADWSKCKEKAERYCEGKGFDMAYPEENLVTQNRSVMIACKK